MTSTVQQFNDMMTQFLTELIASFPEERNLKKYKVSYDLIKAASPRKGVDMYMGFAKSYHTQIMAKDEKFFLENDIDFLDSLNIKKWWNDDLSENTKNAIWGYLQTLNILGTTIVSIPEDAMKTIESVARQVEESMKANGGAGGAGGLGGLGDLGDLAAIAGQIDMNALSSVFSSLGLGKN